MRRAFYTNQSKTAKTPDDFWTDNGAITAYLANAKAVTSRVNSVNKLAYNEDPAIMAYDLINEGRCESSSCTATDMQVGHMLRVWTAGSCDHCCQSCSFCGVC